MRDVFHPTIISTNAVATATSFSALIAHFGSEGYFENIGFKIKISVIVIAFFFVYCFIRSNIYLISIIEKTLHKLNN